MSMNFFTGGFAVSASAVVKPVFAAMCVYGGFRLMQLSWQVHKSPKVVTVRKIDTKEGEKRVESRN